MLKRFFVAAIVGLLLVSSQIVAAEDYTDWSKVPKINNPQEFARYIESQRKAGETKIPVILTNGFIVNTGDFLALCPSSVVSQRTVADDGQTRRVLYKLMDYPSTKVINAYRSGNTTWLNAAEMELYDRAVEIVNEAKKQNGTYNQEYYIYHAIQNRVTYHQEEYRGGQPYWVTAYGALVKGEANCQGYSDAFYLLGNMMGWNVGKMGGGGHQWNTIEFGDGKVYCVDVTWGDDALTYKNRARKLRSYFYFNAPAEIMAATHQWDRALEPANLQPSVDWRYSYYETSSHLRHLSSAEAGLKLLAQKIGNEKFEWFSVMVPYDERYDSFAKASPYFTQELNKTSYRGVYWLRPDKIGKYLFITVDVVNP